MKDDNRRISLIIISLLLLIAAIFIVIAVLVYSSSTGVRNYIVANEIDLDITPAEPEAVTVLPEIPSINVNVEVVPTQPATRTVDAEVTSVSRPVTPEVTTVDVEIGVEFRPKDTESRVIKPEVNVIGKGLKAMDPEILISSENGDTTTVMVPSILVYGDDPEDDNFNIRPEVMATEIEPGVIRAEIIFKDIDGKELHINIPSFRRVGDVPYSKLYEIEAEVLEQAIRVGFEYARHFATQLGIRFEILEEKETEPSRIRAEILVDYQITDEDGNVYRISIPHFKRNGKGPAEPSYNIKAEILEADETRTVLIIAEILAGRRSVSMPAIRRICHDPVYPSYDIKPEVLTNPLNPGFMYTDFYEHKNGMKAEILEDEVPEAVITTEAIIVDQDTGRGFKAEIPAIRRIGKEPVEKTYDIKAEILDKKLQPKLEISYLYHYEVAGEVLEQEREAQEVVAEVMLKEQYDVEMHPEVLFTVNGVLVKVPEIRRIGRAPAEKPYEIEAEVEWTSDRTVLAEVLPLGKNRYGIEPEVAESPRLMLAEVPTETFKMIADIMFDKYETYKIKSEILANQFGIAPEILNPTDNPYGIKAELVSNQYGINPEILSDGSYARYIKAEVLKDEYPMPYVMKSELLLEPEGEGTEFGIMDVRFSDSKIFSDHYLRDLKNSALEEYESMEALTHILNELNSEYISRGYPNAYAYLPEQVVDDGVFFVKLIEGVIGKVILENNKYTNDVYILSHFHLVPGDLFDISDLEQQLLLYNKWAPGVAITARLEPGEEEGSTDIILTAHEVNPTEVMAYGDNYGSAGYGTYRAGASVSMNSLTKNRDILAYGVTLTEGSLNLFADYSLLTPKLDIRLGIRGSYGESLVSTMYEDYHIKGLSRSYALYTTIPIQRTLSTMLTFSASGNYSYARSSALDPEVIISEEVITNVTAGLTQVVSTDNMYAYGSANISFGLPYYDTISDYMKLDGQLGFRIGDMFGIYLTNKTQVQFVLDTNNLPKSLELQVGGSSNVRGYKERCAWGKEGVLTSFEYHIGFEPNVVDVFGFLDFAFIKPYPDTGDNFLLSAGLGANVTFAKFLSVKVAAGFPLIALSVQDPNADDQCRVHIGLSLNF